MNINQLKTNLEKLSSMPEEDAKQTILEALSMTQSWLKLDDLQYLLPEDNYSEIKNKLEKVIADKYPENENHSGERLKATHKAIAESTKFFVFKDKESGKFLLRRYDYLEMAEMADIIYFSELDSENMLVDKLSHTALSIMQAHRRHNRFHGNGVLSAEKIPEVLDSAIAGISAAQSKSVTPEMIEDASNGVTISDFNSAITEIREETKGRNRSNAPEKN